MFIPLRPHRDCHTAGIDSPPTSIITRGATLNSIAPTCPSIACQDKLPRKATATHTVRPSAMLCIRKPRPYIAGTTDWQSQGSDRLAAQEVTYPHACLCCKLHLIGTLATATAWHETAPQPLTAPLLGQCFARILTSSCHRAPCTAPRRICTFQVRTCLIQPFNLSRIASLRMAVGNRTAHCCTRCKCLPMQRLSSSTRCCRTATQRCSSI